MLKLSKPFLAAFVLLLVGSPLAVSYGVSHDDSGRNGENGENERDEADREQEFDVVLSGANEIPPVDNEACGFAHVEVESEVGESEIEVTLHVCGLTDITAAHIHVGDEKTNGPILVTLASGSFVSPLKVEIKDNADAVKAILEGPTYVNVHTSENPDGAVRGQLVRDVS